MEWPEIRPGKGGGGFSKHTWAILKFGCVSWRGDNKERGWSRATLPLERKFISLFFPEEVTVEGWASNTLPFDFHPSLWSCHTIHHVAVYLCLYAHQKACNQTSNNLFLFVVLEKHPFTLISNYKQACGLWLSGFGINVTESCILGIRAFIICHSCGILVLIFICSTCYFWSKLFDFGLEQ